MKENKLITFVVPCYNSQDYMEKCVDSLLKGGEKAEILIIDDGSTDRTGEIADRYERDHPGRVRALHQENGGHGECINHGLREASGVYFIIVDSDDWLAADALQEVLDCLESFEKEGGIDLCICNYVYDHQGKKRRNQTIRYGNIFPQGEIFGWEQTKAFRPWQLLTLHSCIYRTEILRACHMELPKHVFYEDNLFVYYPLPNVKKMYYMNADLYHYFIGREDQSVSETVIKKRCGDQILITTKIFKSYHLEEIAKDNLKLAKYMYHEMVMMATIATAFTRLNNSKEADAQVEEMWKDLESFDEKLAHKIKHASIAAFENIPGRVGRLFGMRCYRIAHRFVLNFN